MARPSFTIVKASPPRDPAVGQHAHMPAKLQAKGGTYAGIKNHSFQPLFQQNRIKDLLTVFVSRILIHSDTKAQ